MQSILNLICKDMYLQRYFLLSFLIFEVFTILSLYFQMPDFLKSGMFTLVQLCAIFFAFTLSFRLVLNEEKYKVSRFLNMLPISRYELFYSKYISAAIFVTLNIFILYILYALVQGTPGFENIQSLSFKSCILGLVIQLFLMACFLSISLGFKSNNAIWVPFPIIFIGMNIAINYKKIIEHLGLEWFSSLVASNHLALIILLLFLSFVFIEITRWRIFSRKTIE